MNAFKEVAWTPPNPVDVTYLVYRNDALVASVRVGEHLDTDVAAGAQYEYRIEVVEDDVATVFPGLDSDVAQYLSVFGVGPVVPSDEEECFPSEEELAERDRATAE